MIPSKLYKKIVESVPILCVDVILVYKGKFVLVKRKNEPLKNSWWVIGGRALKGEMSYRAAVRKVKEETGLKVTDYKFVGIYEDHYKKSAFGIPTSSVSIVYRAEVEDFKPTLDNTSSDIKLAASLPHRFSSKLTK